MFLGTINSAGLNENRRIAAISQKNQSRRRLTRRAQV